MQTRSSSGSTTSRFFASERLFLCCFARITPSALFAMRFQVPGDAQGSAFELWIDDVAFLCNRCATPI